MESAMRDSSNELPYCISNGPITSERITIGLIARTYISGLRKNEGSLTKTEKGDADRLKSEKKR